MENNPRECMFCHGGLPVVPDEPVNMAFLAHINRRIDCRQAFDAWTEHMQTELVGH